MSILKTHIYIDDIRMRDLVNDNDLRFFRHQKQVLNKMLDTDNGFIVKIDSWDYNTLLNDYEICNRIKHINIMKPFCYFEFEFDILFYLGHTNKDEFEDISVIISPYFQPVQNFLQDKHVILQIINFMYVLFFKHGIGFKNFNIENIYVNIIERPKTIKYNFNDVSYSLKTNNVVIFDDFCNSYRTTDTKYLIPNVKYILNLFSKDYTFLSSEPMEVLNQIHLFLL
jgi:hypothetical protein